MSDLYLSGSPRVDGDDEEDDVDDLDNEFSYRQGNAKAGSKWQLQGQEDVDLSSSSRHEPQHRIPRLTSGQQVEQKITYCRRQILIHYITFAVMSMSRARKVNMLVLCWSTYCLLLQFGHLFQVSGEVPDASPDRHSIRSPSSGYVDPSLPEPPLITANTVLSILAVDYPVDKVSCYVSDDGSAMLTFEALSETAEFARKWVPFCKKHNIEPRAPEFYFAQKIDYLKDKIQPSFVKERRAMKSMKSSRWSGVGIEDWWRNEQFWVIGGTSAHLFAVFQGLLKVLAGIDTSFTVTSKASDEDGEFTELYIFKWTSLLIPPTTVLVINMVGIVAGVSYAVNSGYQSWGPLFGRLFFAFWVIAHLYPFLKGLMGRQNRTPTIVIVWSILLASIFSLLWVHIDPFTSPTQKAATMGQCGVNC
ncbi:hypothetical protein B296_00035467 [Ensete ventricosum]|uniref:Cellulose synthase n=1 Tax=Ensete ventricosum TaxID=4639 RepID=A0A426Y9K0_ENSVE|nr:hypothetical protein B296_00035467 [Ensete ventricosum]